MACDRLSRVGVLSKRLNESSWVLVRELPSTHPTLGQKEIRVFSKNTGIYCKFVLNSKLRNFCFGISIGETCYRLSSRKVDSQRVINWTVVGQLNWQSLPAPTLDHCKVYRRDRQALCTATADTCFVSSFVPPLELLTQTSLVTQPERYRMLYTTGDSDVISFHIYASWFSPPCCG